MLSFTDVLFGLCGLHSGCLFEA